MAAIGTRLLKMTIGGNDVEAQISKAIVTSGEASSDFVTFAEAAAGGAREYKLALTAVQDPAANTIWSTVFDSAGSSVACVYKPFGNATPTPTQPHFTFNAIVSEPDGDLLGSEADASATARALIELEWTLTGKPTKVTA